MKSGLVISIVFLAVLSFAVGIFYFSNRYKSAFEADQQCHSEMLINHSENSRVNCDHDLETRQWILFENGTDGEPAMVLNRFRY